MDVDLLWGVFASSIAGLSTVIGAIPILFINDFTPRIYAIGLATSSGILIYISFIEIFPEGFLQLIDSYLYRDDMTDKEKEAESFLFALVSFFGGYLTSYLIDVLIVPFCDWMETMSAKRKAKKAAKKLAEAESESLATMDGVEFSKKLRSSSYESDENDLKADTSGILSKSSHSTESGAEDLKLTADTVEDNTGKRTCKQKFVRALKACWFYLLSALTLKPTMIDDPPNEDGVIAFNAERKTYLKLGLSTAIALFLHNCPEGVATYAGFVTDPSLGISLAIAIAFHNIPEGATVAIPVYLGTGSKKKAFAIASASGLAETLSSVLAFLVIPTGEVDVFWFGLLYCFLAGLMTRVATRALLVTSIKFDPDGVYTTPCFLFGMMVMALSLLSFQLADGNPEQVAEPEADVFGLTAFGKSANFDLSNGSTSSKSHYCGTLVRPILSARRHIYHKEKQNIFSCSYD